MILSNTTNILSKKTQLVWLLYHVINNSLKFCGTFDNYLLPYRAPGLTTLLKDHVKPNLPVTKVFTFFFFFFLLFILVCSWYVGKLRNLQIVEVKYKVFTNTSYCLRVYKNNDQTKLFSFIYLQKLYTPFHGKWNLLMNFKHIVYEL